MEVNLEMVTMTEYIRVTPTSERTRKPTVPAVFESLHKLKNPNASTLSNRVNPFVDTSPPVFEFLAISEGAEEPVEFHYGVDQSPHLDTLEKQLKAIYPATFDIERATFSLQKKLIPPVEFSVAVFKDRLEADQLVYSPTEQDCSSITEENAPATENTTGVTDSGETTVQGEAWDSRSASPDRYIELDEQIFELDPSTQIPEGEPLTALDRPTITDRGTVLARPSIQELDPIGVQWSGRAERKQDWMTTLKLYANRDPDPNEYDPEQHPIGVLIDHLTEATQPIAFQVVWQRKPDWSDEAELRKEDLMEGRDTFAQRYLGPVFEMEERPDEEREYQVGSAATNRFDRIEAKHPKRTFTVNVRAVALPVERDSTALETRFDQLAQALDPLDGPFYRIDGQHVRSNGFRKKTKRKRARRLLQRVQAANIVTGRGKQKPDLVLNGDELGNLVVVPSAAELSIEGSRGARSEQQSRNPLPRPHPDLMEQFRDGMAIGYALDETGKPEEQPTCIPPSLLPTHFARFGTTGAGKSKASINDALSLYDATDGPVIIIDPKGDGMCQNYMRAHARRFGVTDLEENVLHFPIPEILPGFAFFNIKPALASDVNRIDAIQDKADHYEAIIKMVMGEDRYEQAVVAPNLIKYLTKVLYDEEYGLENGVHRESVDYFGHDQLENVLDQLWQAGPPDPDDSSVPRSDDPQVSQKILRQLQLDPNAFAMVMGGVSNRLDYISQDDHLRRIFNNTEPRFDFRDLLDERKVILFELGDLRDDAAKVMTGLIMTMLYDALNQRKQSIKQKPENYVVNLLVDEASNVVVSEAMNTLLEKGRSFRLSVGLSLQFPEQLETEGNRKVYLNVLNDVGSPIVGKIHVDQEIARVMAHEDMDPETFADRIRSLPRGEWITRLPSPTFGETGPEPFSLSPLPIPPGHPESEYPFSDRDETEFQDALTTLHERTQDSYGVPVVSTRPTSTPITDVTDRNGDEQSLDVTMAQVVRTVQISEGVRDENGWVPVTVVDTELLERVDADELDHRGYDVFPDVRESSPLIDIKLHDETSSVLCRLTADGEVAAKPDTSSPTGGGEKHDRVLFAIEEILDAAGFSMQVLDQNGHNRPDAVATHPEVDPTFNIEVETTTHTRPAKILTNLTKAQEADRIPLFVVTTFSDQHNGHDVARRVANILEDPVRRLRTGDTRLYTTNDTIAFNGGAAAPDGVSAARSVTDNSRQTRWFLRDGTLVLEDGAGETHVRLRDLANTSKDQFPATYSYDEDTGKYTVFKPGELPGTYESRDAFEADWVPVKRPFVPKIDLPVPDYGPNSYAILVVDEQNGDIDAHVFDPTTGMSRDLSALLEDINSGELHPAGTGTTNDSATSTDAQLAGDEHGIEAFAGSHLDEDEDGLVAVAEVYTAYQQFVENTEYDTKGKTRFTPALKEYVDTESKRKYLDGDTRRCYIGVKLTDDATH